jgi:hypothetical protein
MTLKCCCERSNSKNCRTAEQVRYFRPNLTVIVEPSFNVIM